MTWDILFLIPMPWVGPVFCPCIISLTMILLALVLVYWNEKDSSLKVNRTEWIIFITGSVVVILSFVLDCYHCVQTYKGEVLDAIAHYVPLHFDWWIFVLGELLIFSAIVLFHLRCKKLTSQDFR
jgi:predicted transporter